MLITTFNRADLLLEAIESVRQQTYQNFEIIVADDGSTDETADRCAPLDGAIRYFRLEHSGTPEIPRNHAIDLARGELIAFLDDDDLWQPAYLERQIELFDREPAIGFTYGNVCFLYPDGSISTPRMLARHQQAESIFDHLLGGSFIYPSTLIVRRTLFQELGPIDTDVSSQGDFAHLLRLAYHARAACLTEALVLIRRHPQNLSQQREIQDVQNIATILERWRMSGQLTPRQQLHARRTLSHLYNHVGIDRLSHKSAAEAQSFFTKSIRRNPFQRRAWLSLTRSYFTHS